MNNNIEIENPIRSAHINIMSTVLERVGKSFARDLNEITHIAFDKREEFVEKYKKRSTKLMLDFLHEKRPEYGMITKEKSYQEDAEFHWVINPLNGVGNFTRGISFCCCSIALVCDGQIMSGMILDPIRREIFCAELDEGAFLNHRLIKVSKNIHSKHSMFGDNIGDNLQFGSSLLNIAYVASGKLDGCFEKNQHLCDSAAGLILVHEAGGLIQYGDKIIKDMDSYKKEDIICSNVVLHDQLLDKYNHSNYR